ncbi:hypothetical protein [Rickettsia endosymbiont of Ceutorhynchus obstrictus]|uniref:hypothetical protein n=1 Tax=Rickettsia endosymbiont of Ceutorhynchus obstrictus TaxID=3066249 RepID=UPI0031331E48
MDRLLEATEETIEASIDSCNAIMPFDMSDKLPEPQTNIDDNIIEASKEIAKIVQDLHKLQELKQILHAKEDDLKDIVTNYMGLHTILTINTKPLISWKNCTRSSLDLAAFKAEYHELYGLFLTETTSRVFRLS